MREDFAIFICTYGRPNNQLTLKTLQNLGYTGRWYLILDDTDTSVTEYFDKFSADNIYVFNKNHYINSVETISNNPKYATILYAKCAVEDIAKSLNLSAFVILDDDLTKLRWRFVNGEHLGGITVTNNIDKIFDVFIDYLLDCNLSMIGPAYMVTYMCGIEAFSSDKFQGYRIPYHMTFRNTKYALNWISDYAEDNISAYQASKLGAVMLYIPDLLEESVPPKRRVSGGMSDVYATDTLALIMRCIVAEPAIFKAKFYNGKFVPTFNRTNSFPKIISERYKKYE